MSNFSDIRRIDNSRVWMPVATAFTVIFSIVLFVWFFRGESFRLYASIFFGLYYLTNQIWVSVLLIGILQNIIFLPLRFVGLRLSTSLKSFEDQLDNLKTNEEQYILFQQKVKKGDFAITFYIFNFLLNAIAFFSAGRIFLIDFYTIPLDPKLIYHFIPYPQYPLVGTNFNFPFFNINSTSSVPWHYILYFWLGLTALLAAARFLWRLFSIFLRRNQTILGYRIRYNKLLVGLGGIGFTLIILSTIFLRNIPTSFSFRWLTADLTRQNSTMNLITAIGTFLTTVIAGIKANSIAAKNLKTAGVPEEKINAIIKARLRQSFQNGIILGIGAYAITSQIPSAFELSVATFEVLYILSPLTFDKFLLSVEQQTTANPDDSNKS